MLFILLRNLYHLVIYINILSYRLLLKPKVFVYVDFFKCLSSIYDQPEF